MHSAASLHRLNHKQEIVYLQNIRSLAFSTEENVTCTQHFPVTGQHTRTVVLKLFQVMYPWKQGQFAIVVTPSPPPPPTSFPLSILHNLCLLYQLPQDPDWESLHKEMMMSILHLFLFPFFFSSKRCPILQFDLTEALLSIAVRDQCTNCFAAQAVMKHILFMKCIFCDLQAQKEL